MIKFTEEQLKAHSSIYESFGELRGSMVETERAELIVFMLMWAKFIPQTNGKVIGFFDVLESLDSYEKFEYISKEIRNQTGINMSYILNSSVHFIINSQRSSNTSNEFDALKISLLPAAKLISSGSVDDIESIILFFKLEIVGTFGKTTGEVSINKGILDFSKMIFDDIADNTKGINCLYPAGSASSYIFAKDRNVFLFDVNDFGKALNAGLISLYGKPFKFCPFSSKQKEITFAAPPIGLRPNRPNSGSNLPIPFDENSDSEAISDPHCKMMYLAHENTNKLTILITSLNTLFSKVNGTNFFRKKIVDNNWLDAVIKFPSGGFQSSGIPLVLLVLKKERNNDDKVQFIDFSECKNISDSRVGLDIPKEEINKLYAIYKNKKQNKISKLVPKLQIKINDYQLNLNKYIFSEEQEAIGKLLMKRKTIKLSSIVSFIRPLHIESKKAKNGPEINEIMLSDINSMGEITATQKKLNIREDFFSKTNFPFIQKGDLVISIKGTLGKVGYIPKELINTVPGPSLCILRMNGSGPIKAEYLFQYLLSNIGQKMFFASSQGGSIPFMAIDDLKNFPIPIPTLEEQNKAKKISKRSRELVESIENMQAELDECITSGWLQLNKDFSTKYSKKDKSKKNESQTNNWSVGKTQLESFLNSQHDGLSNSDFKHAIQIFKIINDKYSQNIQDSKRLSDNDFKEAIFQILKKSTELKQKLKKSKEDSS